ncbi:MAG: cob(I)yrinic acid a,c-diamide adenosyltransferase [Phycisphaeraceae bacterium]|nr:cob(I)yrinic acid a,c-diamide adenosyltransferase [Phycisphaeraceae bacterium]
MPNAYNRAMKLYTRRGDDGLTDLFGGQRIAKYSLRVEAYGTVDEVNSAIGLALVCARDTELGPVLLEIQSRLFDLGAHLASPAREEESSSDKGHVRRLGQAHIDELEARIDQVSASLPPMRHFILPGGCELAARLHLARTICRRAERHLAELAQESASEALPLVYLNRLSDLLFAMARRANQLAKVEDIPWVPESRSKSSDVQ